MGLMKSASLRDQITEILRQRLITLEYKPGEILNQERICSELGVSRTPVSQAFERLALDGMVEIVQRIGVMVTPLTSTSVLHLTEVRLNSEAFSARLAVERGTAEEVDAIVKEAHSSAEIAAHDLNGFVVHDRSFHRLIAVASHNPVLSEFIQRVHNQILRFFFLGNVNLEKAATINAEHTAIAEAIAARNADMAEELIRTHIESRREQISLLQ